MVTTATMASPLMVFSLVGSKTLLLLLRPEETGNDVMVWQPVFCVMTSFAKDFECDSECTRLARVLSGIAMVNKRFTVNCKEAEIDFCDN